jgi:fucose permease
MDLKKIISELKRRNVFKVATAYGITGWLIIKIITSISGPLSLPNWFDTAIIILVLIGFPISLLFAWVFELTPEGLKKTKQVEKTASIAPVTGKKLNNLIIGSLKKLSKNSLSNLTPHPAYVFVNYSHPTLLQRYRNLMA